MRRVALALAVALLVAGCGSDKPETPEIALLKDVQALPFEVDFEFESPPGEVRTRFSRPDEIAESGSGAKVQVLGRTVLVVTFTPAATADLRGEEVVPTYTGPKRLRPEPTGPVVDVVKIGDFEAQLDWAIGLGRRVPYEVKRDGNRVILRFGG